MRWLREGTSVNPLGKTSIMKVHGNQWQGKPLIHGSGQVASRQVSRSVPRIQPLPEGARRGSIGVCKNEVCLVGRQAAIRAEEQKPRREWELRSKGVDQPCRRTQRVAHKDVSETTMLNEVQGLPEALPFLTLGAHGYENNEGKEIAGKPHSRSTWLFRCPCEPLLRSASASFVNPFGT